jgi:hypothetical protein
VTCLPGPQKCCCFQSIAPIDNGIMLGNFTETFYWCVPTYKVTDRNQVHKYNVHMPTCCGGLCIDICVNGMCTFTPIPFNIYPVNNGIEEKGATPVGMY